MADETRDVRGAATDTPVTPSLSLGRAAYVQERVVVVQVDGRIHMTSGLAGKE